jgi:hypothetical protein
VVAGGQRPGIPELETPEEREGTYMRVTLMSGLFGAAPASFGTPQIIVMGFEKLRLLAYPLGGGAIMLATTEAESTEETLSAIASIAAKLGEHRKT